MSRRDKQKQGMTSFHLVPLGYASRYSNGVLAYLVKEGRYTTATTQRGRAVHKGRGRHCPACKRHYQRGQGDRE